MALIAQGAKRLAIGDRVFDYRPGQYLVASVDLPITGHYTHASADEPALGFGLILRPSAIASLLLEARTPAPLAPRPRLRGSASPTPRPSSSTPSSAWCACSTARTIATSSRR